MRTVNAGTVEEDCMGLRLIDGAAPELSDTLDKYIPCRRQKEVNEILKEIKATLGENWRNMGSADDAAQNKSTGGHSAVTHSANENKSIYILIYWTMVGSCVDFLSNYS